MHVYVTFILGRDEGGHADSRLSEVDHYVFPWL